MGLIDGSLTLLCGTHKLLGAGFMQKQQMIWNLRLHIVWYVVMICIANYEEMGRHLLFTTFA